MPVTLYRVKAGQVHSLDRLAYAIENDSFLPARPSVDEGKTRYLFSEVGQGIYPILVKGASKDEILTYLKNGSGVRFTIKGAQITEDEETGLEDLSSTRTSMDDFTIYCKWHSYGLTEKAIEIHDAKFDLFKNVTLAAIAPFGAFSPSFGGVAVADVSGGITDGIGNAKALFGGKSGAKRNIGLMVSYLPINGGTDTNRSNLRARRLATIAAAM